MSDYDAAFRRRCGVNRPPGVTAYMWERFLADFAEPRQFWTSEDGDAAEIVVLPSDNSLELIRSRYGWQYPKLAGAVVRQRFVCRARVGREFFDGGSGRSQGVVWQLSDAPTPFPVHVVDPYAAASGEVAG